MSDCIACAGTMKPPVTTHVLNTATGIVALYVYSHLEREIGPHAVTLALAGSPAEGVPVWLERLDGPAYAVDGANKVIHPHPHRAPMRYRRPC